MCFIIISRAVIDLRRTCNILRIGSSLGNIFIQIVMHFQKRSCTSLCSVETILDAALELLLHCHQPIRRRRECLTAPVRKMLHVLFSASDYCSNDCDKVIFELSSPLVNSYTYRRSMTCLVWVANQFSTLLMCPISPWSMSQYLWDTCIYNTHINNDRYIIESWNF